MPIKQQLLITGIRKDNDKLIDLLLAIIYISFISLGLPDALLGAAWPNMHLDLNTSVSYAGIIFMLISVGTVVSSLKILPFYLLAILLLMYFMHKEMLVKCMKA